MIKITLSNTPWCRTHLSLPFYQRSCDYLSNICLLKSKFNSWNTPHLQKFLITYKIAIHEIHERMFRPDGLHSKLHELACKRRKNLKQMEDVGNKIERRDAYAKERHSSLFKHYMQERYWMQKSSTSCTSGPIISKFISHTSKLSDEFAVNAKNLI